MKKEKKYRVKDSKTTNYQKKFYIERTRNRKLKIFIEKYMEDNKNFYKESSNKKPNFGKIIKDIKTYLNNRGWDPIKIEIEEIALSKGYIITKSARRYYL